MPRARCRVTWCRLSHLDDLPLDEVHDLTGGLEADLSEQASGEQGALHLDDPASYVDELRASAGLPPRAGSTLPLRRRVQQGLDITYLVTDALLLPDPDRSRPTSAREDDEPDTTEPEIRLAGKLVCRNTAEAAIVATHLPEHIELTRAERGCLSFEVAATDDPLVWTVEERFASEDAFAAHQARVTSSDWGRSTAGIERQYETRRVAR